MAALHICSYNVAGWKKTLVNIRSKHGSLESWMARHNFDILCLQEVKCTDIKLQEEPNMYAVDLDGT